MPIVSVIVPNYNHAPFLRQRIASILAQTYQDFELILLDDASTDGSREILKGYSAASGVVCLECNETNSGSPFKQWNKGVRMAQGKYVWIAESDDYAKPQFLERLVPLLEADEQVVMGFCRSFRVVAGPGSSTGQSLRECGKDEPAEGTDGEWSVKGFADYNLPDPERWNVDFCVQGLDLCEKYFALITPVPNASSVLFRKAAYEAMGGADEALRLCGDWKTWAAMAMRGKVAYVSEPLNYFRYHGNTARGSAERDGVAAKEFLHVSRWVLERVNVAEPELETIRKARAEGWVPVVLSLRTPPELRREIIDSVRAFDPHPYRWVLGPAMGAVRRKMQRHWQELRSTWNRA